MVGPVSAYTSRSVLAFRSLFKLYVTCSKKLFASWSVLPVCCAVGEPWRVNKSYVISVSGTLALEAHQLSNIIEPTTAEVCSVIV